MVSWWDGCSVVVALYTLYRWYQFQVIKAKLRDIPTIGGDGFITAYISAWRSVLSAHKIIQEGYEQFPDSVFKFPTLFSPTGWSIVVNGPTMLDDIRKAGPDQLSFRPAIRDFLQTDHLFHIDTATRPYHIDVVRVALTRGYGSRFSDVEDEIKVSFKELMPIRTDWTSYALHEMMIHIVCRTGNRVLVGLPLCRNVEYLKLNEDIAIHAFAASGVLHLFPTPLRPLLGKLMAVVPKTNKTLQKHLGPIIQEHLEKEEKYGSQWEDKPNDLISWLIDSAPPECRNIPDVVQRLMLINIASVHTTSMTVTNALFHLAAHQQYIEPLRAEVENVIGSLGWTKEAMAKMYKLDSFLKESSRLNGVGAMSLTRKALQDFPLSNGIVIPAGCSVGVASYPVHHNSDLYEDPLTFNGYRFLPPEEEMENLERHKHQMVSLDYNYLLFGHGRNACPGRFFAVSELKAIVAHVLINYDLRLPGGRTSPPPGRWFAATYAPDRKARLLLKLRSKSQELS